MCWRLPMGSDFSWPRVATNCKSRINLDPFLLFRMLIENVHHGGQTEILPTNERQTRALSKIPPGQQIEVWQKAVETAPSQFIDRVIGLPSFSFKRLFPCPHRPGRQNFFLIFDFLWSPHESIPLTPKPNPKT